jgi:alanyl-tRNA synthetase
MVPTVAEVMRGPYPEVAGTVERVQLVVKAEEEYFLRTVDKGLKKLEKCIESVRKEGRDLISGDDAFDLHQTDGFLIELTEAIAAKNNLKVDRGRFRELMERHRGVSGKDAFDDSVMKAGPFDVLRETCAGTEFRIWDTCARES